MVNAASTVRSLQSLSPLQQAYAWAALAMALQYLFSTLAYAQVFPDIAGKSLNGIIKNSTYLIPGILAVIGVWLFEGRNGIARIFKPYLKLTVRPWWFMLAGAIMLPILLLALMLVQLLNQPVIDLPAPVWPSLEEFIRTTPMLVQVAISDELFWIGFIYPRLVGGGYSRVKAALVIGVLWGMDYLPFILTGFFVAPGLSASSMVLGWFALAPVYIWFYHKTGSATLLVFFNVSMQYSYNILPVLPGVTGSNMEVAMANLVTFIAGMLLWWLYPRGAETTEGRGPGYPSQHQPQPYPLQPGKPRRSPAH